MSEKKYQVFISSTYTDLIAERQKILKILLMADCIPAGMEAFVAKDDEQFNVIKKVIDLCDYYILIIGKRYGTVNTSTGLSYTEMEYDYAKEKNIPVLVFAIKETVELTKDKPEEDPIMQEKLKLFKKKAMNNRLASIWETTEDLTGQVAVSIMNAKNEIIRPGWQRAVDYDETSLRREIMDLQNQNNKLKSELDKANEIISSFSEQNDLAFYGHSMKIPYYSYIENNRKNNTKEIELPEIFSVIATEMMDVKILEEDVRMAIEKQLLNNHYIDDHQLVKQILIHLKALKLIESNWSSENKLLYWGLTLKGKKVRDDIILIRNNKN